MPKSCNFRAKCSDVHFLNHIKARTIPYVVRFQYWPQNFTHTSASWKTHPRHFSLRSQKEGEKEFIDYFAPVHQYSWFWFLCSLVLQKQTTRRPFCSSSTPNPPACNMVVLSVVWRPVLHNCQEQWATAIVTHIEVALAVRRVHCLLSNPSVCIMRKENIHHNTLFVQM